MLINICSLKKCRKLPPDNRKDWRDPNMPVTFAGKVNGIDGFYDVHHKLIQQYFQSKMNNPLYNPHLYQDDPSYWWSKKK